MRSLAPLPVLMLATAAFMPAFAQSKYSTKLAPYVTSPQRVVERMLEMAAVKSNETVFDLGCGDGRVLFTQSSQRPRQRNQGEIVSPRRHRRKKNPHSPVPFIGVRKPRPPHVRARIYADGNAL